MVKVDRAFINAEIVDVFRVRTFKGWIGIKGERFLYVEEGAPPAELEAAETIDLAGAVIAPGLIDAHMHIESSLLTPRRFAEATVPHGTVAVLADPHEVANVAGEEGIRWMIEGSRNLPLFVRFALPSCVPATSPELEWTAPVFDADVVSRFSGETEIQALGEVMDCRRVLSEIQADASPDNGSGSSAPNLSLMMEQARQQSWLVEGHIPKLRGRELSEYLYHGVGSDHTLTDPGKIVEQLSKGVCVMLQEKCLTEAIAEQVMSLADRSRVVLVTDDIEASLLRDGHLSLIVERAMSVGIDPVEALTSATIRPAVYLGFDHGERKRGAIAPGWAADFLILDSVRTFPPRQVYIAGEQVARDGKIVRPFETEVKETDATIPTLPGDLDAERLRIAEPDVRSGIANAVVIENEATSVTGIERVRLRLENGFPVLTEDEDLACVAVIPRNGQGGSVGVVKNLGLRRGAFATCFAHDSHNVLIVGRTLDEMVLAGRELLRRRGGLVVQEESRVVAALDLPIFGLLTDEPFDTVADAVIHVEDELHRLGMTRERPVLMLSLLSLSVSPNYKFTDRGVIDTEKRSLIPAFEAD